MKHRLFNIARRLVLDREIYYTSRNPKMTVDEHYTLSWMGLRIKSEYCRPGWMRFYASPEHEEINRTVLNNISPMERESQV